MPAQSLDEDIALLVPYLDHFHIMTYDYAVSNVDLADSGPMAPNCPLYK